MLKQFWPTTPSSNNNVALPGSGPADQTTPRAINHSNPFEQQQQAPFSPSSSSNYQQQSSAMSPRLDNLSLQSQSPSSGARTPTSHSHPDLHLNLPPTSLSSLDLRHTGPMTPPAHVGASRPTTGITIGDTMGGTSGIGFGLKEPPKMRRAMTGGTGSVSGGGVGGGVKSGLSVSSSAGDEWGEDQGQTQQGSQGQDTPASATNTNDRARAIRGTLTVKLISARNLAVGSGDAAIGSNGQGKPEPYVVAQFEQNEFVSRPALVGDAAVQESNQQQQQASSGVSTAAGKTIPRTNSYGPSLGIASISRAFADAARRTKGSSAAGGKNGASGQNTGGLTSGQTTPRAGGPGAGAGPASPGLGGSFFGKVGGSTADPVWKEDVSFDVTSPNSVLTISLYDRSKAGEGFLGVKEIKPVLKDGVTVDNWFSLSPRGEEHVTGEIWLQISYDALKSKIHLSPKDFEILKLIGRGTFGKVFQVRKRNTKRIYAMKMLSKKDIVAKKEIAHTIGERKILQQSLDSPFLVGLKFSFQTEDYLFFVTDYKSGGELFWHLQKEGRFTEPRARFYIAELVLALEHLHKYDIVYRDLKPENILLDATGHVALCDFGLSKPDLGSGQLTNTFCGTTEYLAPEVLLDDHGYSKLVDFWSLGVLLFEMCCGWSPFYAEDVQQMYKNICFGKIRFPRGVIGDDGKQFVKGLLNRNPKHRLGAERDAAELKEHPFFKSIDWRLLAAKQITPPFKPMVESDESVSNFDPLFTSSDLRDVPFDWSASDDTLMSGSVGHSYNGPGGGISVDRTGKPSSQASGMNIKPTRPGLVPTGSPLTSSVQANFRGFTYTGESMAPISNLAHGFDDSDEGEGDEDAIDEEDDFEPQDEHGDLVRRTSDVHMD
ncbi:kinase-like domain-containing protein [Filobasidium floriforme]|uniref:kinase-like domain-containing protein n=1 Tax=Filobasidium floriforme TaxID=5210 RepID=UPI001E8DE52E|nr:kinase-like domain-containing protein [Filobasidium floriforme]KAH8085250.1 kinase-like domain-containing protein [Filobasidium floriforme]